MLFRFYIRLVLSLLILITYQGRAIYERPNDPVIKPRLINRELNNIWRVVSHIVNSDDGRNASYSVGGRDWDIIVVVDEAARAG